VVWDHGPAIIFRKFSRRFFAFSAFDPPLNSDRILVELNGLLRDLLCQPCPQRCGAKVELLWMLLDGHAVGLR